jgi:hypothetical protein
VPAFHLDDETRHPADLQLMQNGHVLLFRRAGVLRSTVESLQLLGYRVVELDAASWRTTSDMHLDVAAQLGFPSYYGRNMHALNDCLRDVATYEYTAQPADAGFALVLTGFGTYAKAEPEDAQVVADIFASAARRGLLFGHRMLFLLQVEDPSFALQPVGATPVTWNSSEWLRSARED